MSEWQAPNPDFENLVRSVVLSMPAAQHLGFAFSSITPGAAELIQPLRKELTEHNGNFQGGVIGSLADFAGGAAAGTLLPPGSLNMTVDYTVKLLTPARGDRLVARGKVVKPGGAITVATADIFAVDNDRETLCATALVTMRNIKIPAISDATAPAPTSSRELPSEQ